MSGRPSATDSRLRTARFLTLIAEGRDAEQAAREAKIGPWKALRIVTESDFADIVKALRDGVLDHAAVTVAAAERRAA